MTTGAESLLCEIFSCGSLDLKLLDDVGYGWDEVLDQIDWPQEGLDLNDLLRGVFSVGIIKLRDAVGDAICELEAIELNERDLDDDEREALEALRQLDPDNDVQSYHNFLDTHVWFEHHGAVYRRYLKDAVEGFEENTGFCIGGDEE